MCSTSACSARRAPDCPAGVDVPTYKAAVLHQTYRRRLRPAAHYTLGWLPRWARLASYARTLVNGALCVEAVAAVAKRFGGMDAWRPLPAVAAEPFRRQVHARAAGSTLGRRDGEPVLLLVDTFTDFFTPEVGWAAASVLSQAGFLVHVSPREVCCALTWVSTGHLAGRRGVYLAQLLAVEGLSVRG